MALTLFFRADYFERLTGDADALHIWVDSDFRWVISCPCEKNLEGTPMKKPLLAFGAVFALAGCLETTEEIMRDPGAF